MEKRKWILACVMMLSLAAQAQWRVGATVGTDYNVFNMDKQASKAIKDAIYTVLGI